MMFFVISNLKSTKTYESRRVLLSRKTIYSCISKLILQFPYSFHILSTILSIVNFHTVLSMFSLLFYCSHLKAGTVYSSNLSLFRKRSIISQLNVRAATAENEEQDIYSNIIYIGFQDLYSFFEVFFDQQLFLKGGQIN